MLKPWEVVGRGMLPPWSMVRANARGLLAIARILLGNLAAVRALMRQSRRWTYEPPPRGYELPEYEAGMVNRSSRKKYLRPTLYCDCRDRRITAMAQRLGAGGTSARAFAETAFDFVKRNVAFEISPLADAADVLGRGAGSCLHKISLFVALCRAAGIEARYRFFSLTMLDNYMEPEFERAPLIRKWYDAMGSFLLHGSGEARIGGEWVCADVGAEPPRQAASGLPLTRFGEDSIGLWLFPVPGTMFRSESVPLGLGWPAKFLMKRFAGTVAGFNAGILEQIEKGRRIIEAAGGEAAYDAGARRRHGATVAAQGLLEPNERIVFQRD
ncbi:MAG: transglutaminase family protein [Candidatus Aminicenantes bacterium]|nr:transglutaminase family protein [Candidatus Aminicenantes bacterium]